MNEIKYTKIVEPQNSAVQALRDAGATILSVKYIAETEDKAGKRIPAKFEVTYTETEKSAPKRGRRAYAEPIDGFDNNTEVEENGSES